MIEVTNAAAMQPKGSVVPTQMVFSLERHLCLPASGDYVDRGKQSLETVCLVLSFKIKYPENFFILRGNHECASINRIYGFYDECKRRYHGLALSP